MPLIYFKKRSIIGGSGGSGNDPYWNNVVLSMNMNSSFNDEKLHTTTIFGGCEISSAEKKYGSGSGYFGGAGRVSTDASADFSFPGDFTVEFWCKPTHAADYSGYPALLSVGSYSNGFLIRSGGGGASNASVIVNNVYMKTGPIIAALNVWNHIALTRQGSTVRLFINGVVSGTMTVTTTINSTAGAVHLFALASPSQYGKGYMDDLRITKGVARYTSGFTVPTEQLPSGPLTDISYDPFWSNVVFAMDCNSYTEFKGKTITPNGTSISATSKFGSGSLYFNGNSNIASVPAINYGTSSFTHEFWLNPNTTSTTQTVFLSSTFGSGDSYGMKLSRQGTGGRALGFHLTSNGTTIVALIQTTLNLIINSWNHVALVKDGSEFSIFINGIKSGTATWAGNFYNNISYTDYYGSHPNLTSKLTGYIDDIRITLGVPKYTTNFDVPTLPHFNA